RLDISSKHQKGGSSRSDAVHVGRRRVDPHSDVCFKGATFRIDCAHRNHFLISTPDFCPVLEWILAQAEYVVSAHSSLLVILLRRSYGEFESLLRLHGADVDRRNPDATHYCVRSGRYIERNDYRFDERRHTGRDGDGDTC